MGAIVVAASGSSLSSGERGHASDGLVRLDDKQARYAFQTA
jgi:hypothetical protein